jgi:Rad52/22 family double-strand break repair protein
MIDLAALAAPFAPDRVSWRVGSTTKDKSKGMALAYIDARDVMGRLDEVCGPAGWQNRYSHAEGTTICEIGILCADTWVWKADGAGDTDVEKEKGALSDAFKRAAVRWGIGRYLYDVDSPWVLLEEKGASRVIAPGEFAKLRRVLGGRPEPASRPVETYDDPMAAAGRALSIRVNTCATIEKLEALMKEPKFLSDVAALSDEERGKVRKAASERRSMLVNMVGAG